MVGVFLMIISLRLLISEEGSDCQVSTMLWESQTAGEVSLWSESHLVRNIVDDAVGIADC